MPSLFENIIYAIVSTITSIVVSLGLITAPIQPPKDSVVAQTPPIVQEKAVNSPKIFLTKPKPVPQSSTIVAQQPEKYSFEPLNEQLKLLQQKLDQLQQSQTQQSQAIQKVQEQTAPKPSPDPVVVPPKPNMKSLKLVNPGGDHGWTPAREYGVFPEGEKTDIQAQRDGSVLIAAICKDENGVVNKTAKVQVKTTDPSQDKEFDGTGSVIKIWENGQQLEVHAYVFYYEIRTAGKHTITFTCDGMSESAELETNK